MSIDPDLAVTTTLVWSVLRARGQESESFLQGQLSQDLSVVGEAGAWALLLEPDSVVLTSCWVTRREDGFDLVIPSSLAERAAARLRRFVLRTRCALEIDEAPVGPFVSLDDQIAASWPGENEFAALLTPHSFGRHFVETTISFDKGCFTGQELVGRLDARGASVPWRFVRVRGSDVTIVNEYLTSKGPAGPQGVTSAARHGAGVRGLGIAHRTLLSAPPSDATSELVVEEID